jgi:hypothetical protein
MAFGDTMRRTQSLSAAEQALQSQSALAHLRRLVDAGCNRERLIAQLDLAFSFLDDESWQVLVGMDLRRFNGVIREIRSCAAAIDGLCRSQLIYRLSIQHRDPLFVRIYDAPTLPDQLRRFAGAIEHKSKLFGPKRKIREHMWKAGIVAMVIEDTHKAHDSEVSTLIGAVLNNEKYSEKAHQEWRRKHKDFIRIARRQIIENRHRAMSKSLPT